MSSEFPELRLPLEARIEEILLGVADGFPSCEQVARQLCMSQRTLRRRLAQRDRHFHDILSDVRYRLSVHYLESTSLSIQEIADRLGYRDPSNFGRAFRKWRGMSPRQYRSMHKSRSSSGFSALT